MALSIKIQIFQQLFVYFRLIKSTSMYFIKIITLLVLISLVSCKKDRTCECTSSKGTYNAGEVDMSKRQAKKYCKELSSGETTCKLKE